MARSAQASASGVAAQLAVEPAEIEGQALQEVQVLELEGGQGRHRTHAVTKAI